jgi:hypothetical protein
MSEVDRQLSLPSLYGYWLAIGYIRAVKAEGRNYPTFLSEFGGCGLSLYFGFLYQKSSLVRLAPRSEDCASIPRAAMQSPGM